MTDIKRGALWNETLRQNTPSFFGFWFSKSVSLRCAVGNNAIKLSLSTLRLPIASTAVTEPLQPVPRLLQSSTTRSAREVETLRWKLWIQPHFVSDTLDLHRCRCSRWFVVIPAGMRKNSQSLFWICAWAGVGVSPLKTSLCREKCWPLKENFASLKVMCNPFPHDELPGASITKFSKKRFS